MKKIIAIITLLALICAVLVACGAENYQMIAPDATYKNAIIHFPNGEVISISVEVFSSTTYNDAVTIKCIDGTVYKTAWQNVILIGE